MIFGASEDVSGLLTTEAEREMTVWMQNAWASFAADPVHGLESVGWPSYNHGNGTIAVLAEDNNPEVRYVSSEVYNAACEGVQVAGGSL